MLIKIINSCALMFNSEKWHKEKILHTIFFSNSKNTSILTYNTTLYSLSGPESRKPFENVDLNILPKKTVIYYSRKPKSSTSHNTCFTNLETSFFLLTCLIDWNCSTDNHIAKNRFYMKSIEYFSYWNLLYIYLIQYIYCYMSSGVYICTQELWL